MARLKFDSMDRQMLTRFDPDVEISNNDEIAVIKGPMRIEIVRIADDKLELNIGFAELDFPIVLSRSQTMSRLGVKDES
jgi:hypothetical protein